MFYRMKYILCCVLALTMLLAMGCGNEAQEASEEATTRVVTDSTGTEVTIPTHPQRVVFLNVSNMDMYYAAGGTAVGRPSSYSMDEELMTKTKDLPEVGLIHSPNIEAIMALNPDLVVGVNVPTNVALRDTLAQANVPLLINKLDTYEDVINTLDFYGELTGKTDVAAMEKKRIQELHDGIIAKTKGKTPPRSLVVFGAPNSFNMATNKSFSGNLIEQLGGGNIADADKTLDGTYASLSMEYIAQQDPEVIFFISMVPNPETAESFKREMANNSIWQQISAVKNNRIYFLQGRLFSINPGSKIGEAMEIVYKDMYEPEEAK